MSTEVPGNTHMTKLEGAKTRRPRPLLRGGHIVRARAVCQSLEMKICGIHQNVTLRLCQKVRYQQDTGPEKGDGIVCQDDFMEELVSH